MAVLNTLADLKAALDGAATVGADGITITLDRPHRLNAIDAHMPREIRQAVEHANARGGFRGECRKCL